MTWCEVRVGRRTAFVTFLGVAVGIVPCVQLSAQLTSRPLQVEDYASAPTLQGESRRIAALSPSGESVAYVVCDRTKVKVDPKETKSGVVVEADVRMGCDLVVTTIATGATQNVTRGRGDSWSPTWSPDGHWLAFWSVGRGGAPRLWIWNRQTGSLRQTSGVVGGALADDAPAWTVNSESVVVRTRLADAVDAAATSTAPHRDSAVTPGATVVLYRSLPSHDTTRSADSSSTVPPTNEILGDLALVDAHTGRVRVLASGVRCVSYQFSPDGTRIALLNKTREVRAGPEGMAQYGFLFDLETVDLLTGHRRIVVPNIRQWSGMSLSWSPDGSRLAYLSGTVGVPNGSPFGLYSLQGDLYVVDVESGSTAKFVGAPAHAFDAAGTYGLTPLWHASGGRIYLTDGHRLWCATVATGRLAVVAELPHVRIDQIAERSDGGRIWSPDGGTSLVVITTDSSTKRSGAYQVDLTTGAMRKLREDDKEYGLYAPVGSFDGRYVILRAQSVSESEDMWVANSDFSALRRLTMLNPRLATHRLGASRLIDFRSADGEPLRASLLLPADYVPGTRYPLIVNVYATGRGSEAVNLFGMTVEAAENLQLFSTRGYAVLNPDIPVHEGTLAQDIMRAVMPAIDRVVDLGIADPDRLAVMGTSNGGYSTLALLTQTQRFKAGVMSGGFGDLMGMYGQMTSNGEGGQMPLFEKMFDWIGGPPWEFPQRYVDNSPIFFFDRVHTPLLMEVGGADEQFVTASNEVFVDLQRAGKDVTYLRYGGEGHFIGQLPNQIDYWRRVVAFFDSHLGVSSVSSAVIP
jgi:dipeptidyl aminopeptidase/acylaminoacyl peptidase